MQWYFYLVAICAVVFIGHVAVELIGRPLQTALRLRRKALARMRSLRNMALPRPREFAVSSRQIREYDQAVRNLRAAQQTLSDLGAQLLAFSENEPATRMLLVSLGVNLAQSGHELTNLSEICVSARNGSDELRREIEMTFRATMAALGVSRRPSSRDALIRIRLEPMNLHCAVNPRTRQLSRVQSRQASCHMPRQAPRPRQVPRPHHARRLLTEPVAAAS